MQGHLVQHRNYYIGVTSSILDDADRGGLYQKLPVNNQDSVRKLVAGMPCDSRPLHGTVQSQPLHQFRQPSGGAAERLHSGCILPRGKRGALQHADPVRPWFVRLLRLRSRATGRRSGRRCLHSDTDSHHRRTDHRRGPGHRCRHRHDAGDRRGHGDHRQRATRSRAAGDP